MRLRTIISLVLVISSASVVSAQSPYPDRPVDLRVTGMLLSAETPKRDDLATVNIFVRDTPLVLRIGKVEDLPSIERERADADERLVRQRNGIRDVEHREVWGLGRYAKRLHAPHRAITPGGENRTARRRASPLASSCVTGRLQLHAGFHRKERTP